MASADLPAVGSRWHLMAGHGEKLKRKVEEAIAASGRVTKRVEDAARVAGVGVRTLLR